METFTFIIILSCFIYIGYRAAQKKQPTDTDYLLAGKTVSPLLTALSAASSKYSGYMFIGIIGYIYNHGLSAIWIVSGFFFGDLFVFFFVHKKVREETQSSGANSFITLISRWHHGNYAILRIVIGIISLVFLLTYVAAQFNAGGKALYVMFDWHYYFGAIICSVIILAYCSMGGLRASIWTDGIQSITMIMALSILLGSAIYHADGIDQFIERLQNISPHYLQLINEQQRSISAVALFAVGWIFSGIGVTGQPHIMVRFMALDKAENIYQAGIYYFSWSFIFLVMIIGVGLSARLYIDPQTLTDTELALPTLSQLLLPSIATGILLSGIFSAIISTTDSQILSCSAIISEDFKLGKGFKYKPLITLIVTLCALSISLFASTDVFTLVIFSWSALACTMGPLVIIHAFGKRPAQWLCLLIVITGLSTAMLWRIMELNHTVNEALPGIISGLAIYILGSLFTQWNSYSVENNS